MSAKDDLKNRLKKVSSESAARTDALLADEYAALLNATTSDLETLRPKVKDPALFDQLIPVVQEAARDNLSLAAFEQRIMTLGTGAIEIGKQVAKLL